MIKATIYIERFGWLVHAYFHKTGYDVDEIMMHLWDLGCDGETAKRAYENLQSDSLNLGLCYSNYRHQESIFVVGKTSSPAEFLNSLNHELVHLQSHICEVFHLDPMGEEIAYAMGDFSMKVYPYIKHLLCDCNKNNYNYEKKEKNHHYSYYGIG
jgi:hypothetical protein